jgi:hypothetical protein
MTRWAARLADTVRATQGNLWSFGTDQARE